MFPKISKNPKKILPRADRIKWSHHPERGKFRQNTKKAKKDPKMDEQIEKLQKDITGLMESSRESENSSDIPECLKNIQLRFISKLISKARAKIDLLEDMKKCKEVKI